MIVSTSSKVPTDDCFSRPNNRLLLFTAIYTLVSQGQGVGTLL